MAYIDPSIGLYDWTRPEDSMQNVLQNLGYNMWSPVSQRVLMPAARGLGQAFGIAGALGYQGALADPALGFRDFLTRVLTGSDQAGGTFGGGVRGALQGGLSQIPQLAATLRANQNGGSDNPFVGAYLPSLGDPRAFNDMYGDLYGGYAGSRLGRAGEAQAQMAYNQALRSGDPNADIYSYLFGV